MKCIKLHFAFTYTILQLHVERRRDSLTNFNRLLIDAAVAVRRITEVLFLSNKYRIQK